MKPSEAINAEAERILPVLEKLQRDKFFSEETDKYLAAFPGKTKDDMWAEYRNSMAAHHADAALETVALLRAIVAYLDERHEAEARKSGKGREA